MTADVRIIPARDFIRATPEGELDLKASRNALIGVASAATQMSDYVLLIDTRKAQALLSVADLYYLAAELFKLFEARPPKTAVLCPLEEFDSAAFFALCAQNRGLGVEPFTSFEDAINWLMEMEPEAGDPAEL